MNKPSPESFDYQEFLHRWSEQMAAFQKQLKEQRAETEKELKRQQQEMQQFLRDMMAPVVPASLAPG